MSLTEVIQVLPLVGATCAFAWGVYQYFNTRSKDLKVRQFDAYHRLIKELVQPDSGGATYADRQLAAVFELRDFPRYFIPSHQILTGLKNDWANKAEFNARLRSQFDKTIQIIENSGLPYKE